MEDAKFNPAHEYMKFMITKPIMLWRPPANGIYLNTIGLQEGQQVLSVILDRQGSFQTEMFLAHAGTKEAFKHTHLGVDSVEVLISGDFIFDLNGQPYENKSNGQRIGDNFPALVPDDLPHSAVINNGACFFSFQFWKDGNPTTIGNKFEVLGGSKWQRKMQAQPEVVEAVMDLEMPPAEIVPEEPELGHPAPIHPMPPQRPRRR